MCRDPSLNAIVTLYPLYTLNQSMCSVIRASTWPSEVPIRARRIIIVARPYNWSMCLAELDQSI